jgi:spermidine synthase
MNLTFLLFFIIITEGYVVLSTELLAIRQATPFIGNGTDTVSIIIAAVLMPLAVGYYIGGRYRPKRVNGRYMSIREKLARNIIISAAFLLPCLSYVIISIFFFTLLGNGVDNRIVLVSLYCIMFLVVPVFLLGQTVPLVSNYFSSKKLSAITGKMLFCSTVGSFLGAILSSLVLMNFAGVHNAVNVVFIFLTLIIVVMSKDKFSKSCLAMFYITGVALFLNSNYIMKRMDVVSNNSYNTINIVEATDGRHLLMNNNDSSLLGPQGQKHRYVEYVEKHFLKPILGSDVPPKRILIVGSAGFTFGLEDKKNTYVYVDIDPAVKGVAEKYFLKQKLGSNKSFVPQDIRSYLMQNHDKFDLIFLDAYLGGLTLPESLVTREFFLQLKDRLNPHGIIAANFITSPNFYSRFSQKLDNTFRSVFPHIMRQSSDPDFDGWKSQDSYVTNIIYSSVNVPDDNTVDIYTDDKHPVSFDKPKKNGIIVERVKRSR